MNHPAMANGNIYRLRPLQSLDSKQAIPFDSGISEKLNEKASQILRGGNFTGCYLSGVETNDKLLLSGTFGNEIYGIFQHLPDAGKSNLRKQLTERVILDIYA